MRYKKGSLGWLRELAKEHGFGDNTGEFVRWAQKNGFIKDPADANRERNEGIAKRAGFKDRNEYAKHVRDNDIEYRRKYTQQWRYDNCVQRPMSENPDCAHYLGTLIAERKYGRIRNIWRY